MRGPMARISKMLTAAEVTRLFPTLATPQIGASDHAGSDMRAEPLGPPCPHWRVRRPRRACDHPKIAPYVQLGHLLRGVLQGVITETGRIKSSQSGSGGRCLVGAVSTQPTVFRCRPNVSVAENVQRQSPCPKSYAGAGFDGAGRISSREDGGLPCPPGLRPSCSSGRMRPARCLRTY